MNKIEINIVEDILDHRFALHDLGKPVAKFLAEIIEKIIEPTLIIINLRNADPMDYEFVIVSFRELILKYLKDPNLYLVFKVSKDEKEELFRGFIDILGQKKNEGGDEIETLKRLNFFLITVTDDNEVEYLTSLCEKDMDVLKEIETHNNVQSKQIQDIFKMIAEDTTQILQNLMTNKFIYKTDEVSGPFYNSIKSIF